MGRDGLLRGVIAALAKQALLHLCRSLQPCPWDVLLAVVCVFIHWRCCGCFWSAACLVPETGASSGAAAAAVSTVVSTLLLQSGLNKIKQLTPKSTKNKQTNKNAPHFVSLVWGGAPEVLLLALC